jgi:arginase
MKLIGYACGNGAANVLCGQGPIWMQKSSYLQGMNVTWSEMLTLNEDRKGLEALGGIIDICQRLAKVTYDLTQEKEFFVTLGGDHSAAIGTWSGVASALLPKTLGLLWIDAHLDSHTFQTTPSGNIHGMPLASLLGHGDIALRHIASREPKLLPQNVCVLGVRSYEEAEKALLERLNVRVFYMDEIKERGLEAVFNEAIERIRQHTDYYGISLDLDGIDPHEAPGVGTPEPEGISMQALYQAFFKIAADPKFIAAELVEFNPNLDKNRKTEKIIADLLALLSKVK